MFGAFPSRFRLCELFGIPLYIDLSLVLLLFFFVSGGGSLFDGLACALLLLLSVTAHEFGHSLTARAFGYETRDVTLSLLGGCASLIALPRKAGEEFLTALAGPAVSFVLSFFGVLVLWASAAAGGLSDAFAFVWSEVMRSFGVSVSAGGGLLFSPRAPFRLLEGVVYFSVMNGVLGFFNLLPGFPLDGGRVFRSAMRSFLPRDRATYWAMAVGRAVAVAIGLSGVWRIANGRAWGFVTLMIAWMIWKEGYREYQLARVESCWGNGGFRARVSPPPYGGDGDDCAVRRDR
jgi:stage IV sporulation protein FB